MRDKLAAPGDRALGLVLVFAAAALAAEPAAIDPEEYPETPEIEKILAANPPPDGVLFNVMEYDEDALEWVTVRLEHYVDRLLAGHPGLSIAVVSHGDEMFALTTADQWLYPKVHERVQRLVEERDVIFHVCGATAQINGIDMSEFPQYIDVVPSASTQIRDYREFGYQVISMELTW